MERVKAAMQAQDAPTEAERRYGPKWQEDRRMAERTVRVAAIAFRRWTEQRNVARALAAKALGIPERTLAAWESDWERNHLRPNPRGRSIERSPVELRNLVVVVFRLMRADVGVPILRLLFPEMPKRELEDMSRRYKRLQARKRRLAMYRLRWKMPGSVWAIDHSKPPAPVDGVYPAILAVRDLASGNQLAWEPVQDETGKEVRLVLESLIAEHGAPLLIKKDNGSALNEADLDAMLDKLGIVNLLSPFYTPSYNGSCEAGNGSLKKRARHQAALHDRPGRWTTDDCEAARLEANLTARPWGVTGPTPEEVWSKRDPISDELRRRFQRLIAHFDGEERKQRGYLPGIELDSNVEASITRAAIRRALVACGLLEIRRGQITLPISA